jgi:hypothetical protein
MQNASCTVFLPVKIDLQRNMHIRHSFCLHPAPECKNASPLSSLRNRPPVPPSPARLLPASRGHKLEACPRGTVRCFRGGAGRGWTAAAKRHHGLPVGSSSSMASVELPMARLHGRRGRRGRRWGRRCCWTGSSAALRQRGGGRVRTAGGGLHLPYCQSVPPCSPVRAALLASPRLSGRGWPRSRRRGTGLLLACGRWIQVGRGHAERDGRRRRTEGQRMGASELVSGFLPVLLENSIFSVR